MSGTTVTYAWDGAGNRFSATTGGTTTRYVYDANRSLPVLLDDGTRKYVWGLGLLYSVDASANVAVSLADGLGSVRALTDGVGSVVETYTSDAFGVPTLTQGTSAQPFQYTGEQRDPTGLVFLRARMYDPGVGRFIQRDLLGGVVTDPLSLNRYSYARNNPATLMDPSGRDPLGVYSHTQIEHQFVLRNRGFAAEVTIAGVGRLDLYNEATGFFYEIKPWYLEAQGVRDIGDYISDARNLGITLRAGPSLPDHYYAVMYTMTGVYFLHAWHSEDVDGLILYEWTMELPAVVPNPMPNPNHLPRNFPRPQPQTVPINSGPNATPPGKSTVLL